jgi:hypothetical protein
MALPGVFGGLVDTWMSLYDKTRGVQNLTLFAHLAGLLFGGGAAVAFDRETMRMARAGTDERACHLNQLPATHRAVLAGLALVAISGLLMFAADIDTFARSWVFWLKMGLVATLVTNGYLLDREGAHLLPDDLTGWKPLRLKAALSMLLWLATLLAGVVLVSVA